MMVTVASSLDVPIKLMFPKPGSTGKSSAAMLGLGDIVIPGLMIGLALRFDLYLFYLRRQKRVPATTEGGEDEVIKAEWYPVAGRWSDRFWTHSFIGRPLWSGSVPSTKSGQSGTKKEEPPFTFPKTYFNAALVGYVGGLIATLCALHLMNHAQPALLWLVPGVLISLWSTALVRGEVGLMWNYSEEIIEQEDKHGNKDKDKGEKGEKHEKRRTQQWIKDDDKAVKPVTSGKLRRPEREVFSFSIEAPRKPNRTASTKNGDVGVLGNGTVSIADGGNVQSVGNGTFWAGSSSSSARQDVDVEPAGKRLRMR
jgi:minor histocompatibility antigen H13